MNKPPVLTYEDFDFGESSFKRGKKRWMATTLLRAVHEQGLLPFEYPVACYDMSNKYFTLDNVDEFVYQMKRTLEADYESHPIILDDFGQVADGNHRLCHAILDGKRSVLAYRLKYMPEPDFEDKK